MDSELVQQAEARNFHRTGTPNGTYDKYLLFADLRHPDETCAREDAGMCVLFDAIRSVSARFHSFSEALRTKYSLNMTPREILKIAAILRAKKLHCVW
jgi:hypothetical protein